MKIQSPRYGHSLEEDIKGLFGILEATDHEKYVLWRDHSKESCCGLFRIDDDNKPHQDWSNLKFTWSQQGSGYHITVGYILDTPVCISIMFATIGGKRVMFWHATSEAVYYPMIMEYLKKLLPNYDELSRTDAGNFTNLLHTIQDANK